MPTVSRHVVVIPTPTGLLITRNAECLALCKCSNTRAAAVIIPIDFFEDLTLNLEVDHEETTQENLPVSQNANKPPLICLTLTQGTLAGLCHQVGASNFEPRRTPKEREETEKCVFEGRCPRAGEPQGCTFRPLPDT